MPTKKWDGPDRSWEPRWDEMLDDPVIHAVMQRDGVRRESLLDLMTEMRERLEVARASAETAEHWSE
jgi:hypothetical protein